MNYKNKKTGEVIEEECYDKLPSHKKDEYRTTYESPTHKVSDDNDDGDLLGTIIALGTLLSSPSTSSNDVGGGSSSDFGGFDGGSGGGGGASGDW